MNPELKFYAKSLARMIYVVCEEEDRFLLDFQEGIGKFAKRTFVFNAALGLVPIEQLTKDWLTRAHAENREVMSIHDALINIYKEDSKQDQCYYLITDPERWLGDAHVVRRLLNIMHQAHQNLKVLKTVIFVGTRKVIPEKLQRYMEVVHIKGLTKDEVEKKVAEVCQQSRTPVPENPARIFGGLTAYEIQSVVAQSIVATRDDPKNAKRIDPAYVAEYKRRGLQRTDLLQYIDTKGNSFDDVGGVARFKEWARKTKHAWSDQGQAFGLKPPKGVLAVGVWGCGKSLSVKAMGAAWGLPVVQLEMGRLRSSGVGESEANVYRACRLIESVAPCVVWVDEAEKSLSGNASSGMSDAGTTSRTIGILSTWLQETTAPVCLAMTANSLKTLPVEFVNRMDERFFFDLPHEDERLEILKIHLRKVGQDPAQYNLAELAELSKNMVGREIEQAIGAAMVESFDQKKPNLDEGILSQILSSKPRIFRTMGDELKELTDWVGYSQEQNEGIRARLASDGRSASFALLSGE